MQKFNLVPTIIKRVVLLCALLFAGSSMGQSPWKWANPFPQGNTLNKVIYAKNMFVAVGNYGTIMSSPDGRTWSLMNTGVQGDLRDICYGNDLFVAVGDNLFTSPDGVNWTERTLLPLHPYRLYSDSLFSVTYGNNMFIAVGDKGEFYTSLNGVDWESQTPKISTEKHYWNVAFGNNQFALVVMAHGVSWVYTSIDTKTWKFSLNASPVADITYKNNSFLAVTMGGTFISSVNDSDWTKRYLPDSITGIEFQGITYGNNQFVAVGNIGTGNQYAEIFSSANGELWTRQPAHQMQGLRSVAFGADQFVTVGVSGTIAVSQDGLNWEEISAGVNTRLSLRHAAFGNDLFVAVGYDDVMVSHDGTSWKHSKLNRHTSTSGLVDEEFKALTYANSTFAAVVYLRWGLDSSIIYTSVDGISWTPRFELPDARLQKISYFNNRFTAWENDTTIVTSLDGLTWKKLTTEECLNYPKGSIAYGNDLFVLVDNYRIKKSPDGKTWTDVVLDKSDWGAYGNYWSLQKITFGNNLFVAIGSESSYGYYSSFSSYFLSSPDGVHWDIAFILSPRQYTDILYVNGQFVAVDKYGNTISSTDGKKWTENYPKMCSNLNALAFGDNKIIAVGDSGAIFSQKSTGQNSNSYHGFNSELNISSGKLNLTMDSKSVSISGSFTNSKKLLYIQIVSISGKRAYFSAVQNYNGKATFSTSAFTNGVYILKVNDGKNTFVSPQFVIMR